MPFKKKLLLCFIFFCLTYFSSGKAAEAGNSYYLSTTGSDSNPGTSTGSAWATLNYAGQQLQGGDTLYVMNGTYTGQHGVISNSGTDGNPITITAYSGTPKFDGVDKTGIGINVLNASWVDINGLEVYNYSNNIYSGGSASHTNSHVTIRNCISHDSGGNAIQISPYSDSSTIDSCIVFNSGYNGITLYGNRDPRETTQPGNGIAATNLAIRNSEIYNCNNHNCIDLYGTLDGVVIENNNIHDSVYNGIYSHSGYDTHRNITIRNNILTGLLSGMNMEAIQNGTIENNTISNVVRNGVVIINIQSVGNPTGNITIQGNALDCSSASYEAFQAGLTDIRYISNTLLNNSVYRFNTGTTGNIVRDAINSTYSIKNLWGASSSVEYTTGKIFTASGVDVNYYPAKSSADIAVNSSKYITAYPACAVPTSDYLTITPNTINQTTDIWDFTVNSNVAENPTTFTFETLHPGIAYSVRRDNTPINTAYTDNTGKLVYTYSVAGSEFSSSHNFKFINTGQPAPNTYALTVTSGAGSGYYTQGAVVTVTANAASSGTTFDQWTGDTGSVASSTSSITNVIMPAATVYITATYKNLPASNDATAYTFAAPSPASGPVNAVSDNFTVTPNGHFTGTITVTPSGGGLSAPIVLTFSNSSAAQTFTVTPAAAGTVTLAPTNNGGLADPLSVTYTATGSAGIFRNTAWNYPNPVNFTKTNKTTIVYTAVAENAVSIRIYAISGELVKTLVDNKTVATGKYSVDWFGDTDNGGKAASGAYLSMVKIGKDSIKKKIVILR